MVDPVTLGLLVSALAPIVVAMIVITMARIVQWFRSRRRISIESTNAIGVTLAERINNKQFVSVPGVFGKTATNTRLIQAIYDTDTHQVLAARAIAGRKPPTEEVIRLHEEGQGLVVYT